MARAPSQAVALRNARESAEYTSPQGSKPQSSPAPSRLGKVLKGKSRDSRGWVSRVSPRPTQLPPSHFCCQASQRGFHMAAGAVLLLFAAYGFWKLFHAGSELPMGGCA